MTLLKQLRPIKLVFPALLLTILLCATVAIAVPDFRTGPAPGWVTNVPLSTSRPDLKAINNGHYMELYEYEEHAARAEAYSHIVRNIITGAGVQEAGNITINFNPSYERLTVHRIVVWRNGMPENRLRKEDFRIIAAEDDLSRFIYNGTYSAYLILKDVRNGDKIEYDYTITGRNPAFKGKIFDRYIMQSSDPIGKLHYRIIMPSSRHLNFSYKNNATTAVQTSDGNNTVYDWDLTDVKGLGSIGNVPSWFTPYPYVQISEFASWKEVASWAYSINQPSDHITGALAARLESLKKEYPGDPYALFRAIVNIVQHEIRYMGVEIGTYSHTANAPEKVYEQRYGDCKDKSLLLVSMLHAVGIKAEMALVSTGLRTHLTDMIPSPSLFNHAIAVAHIYDDDIWVDATMSYQGGKGRHIYCPEYGKALVLKPETDDLVFVTAKDVGEVRYTETYDATDLEAPVILTITTTYTAKMADDQRYRMASQSKMSIEKSYLDYYTRRYPDIDMLDTMKVEDDVAQNIITITETYKIKTFFETDTVSGRKSADFYASLIREVMPITDNKKNYPLATTYPYNMHYTVLLNAPLNWDLNAKSKTLARNAYNFSYGVSATPDQLTLEYDLNFLEDHIKQEDLAQYEQDRKNILDEYLSFSFSHNVGAGKRYPGINLFMVFIALLTTAGVTILLRHIYRRPTERAAWAGTPLPLGGWLILPIIGIFFTIISVLYSLVTASFFKNVIWHAYDGKALAGLTKVILVFEVMFNVTTIIFAVFCLILIFRRRDITPLYVRIFFIGKLSGLILDELAGSLLNDDKKILTQELTGAIIYTAIWSMYFYSAQRVRETFTIPYPEDQPWPQTEEQPKTTEEEEEPPLPDNVHI